MESNLKLAKTAKPGCNIRKLTVGIDEKSHMCYRIWEFGGHVLQVERPMPCSPLQLKIVFLEMGERGGGGGGGGGGTWRQNNQELRIIVINDSFRFFSSLFFPFLFYLV